ncbi:MAG: glutathione S-transferase family protein [Alphaproteobacteria bacterium]|nr:glutathione S-transferase family protein [Alphaproteobacteria bacterium]
MALKIYGLPRSRAIRNMWACEEGGVAYELVRTSWNDGGTKTPEFLKLNPNAAVPVMDDDGFPLFESLAINLYIGKNKAKGLYPTDAKGEAKLWQWTLWAATELEPHNGAYAANTYMLAPEKRDPAVAAAAWTKLSKALGVLDQHLAAQPWMLGGSFSLADINVSGILLSIYLNNADFSAWKNTKAWLDRCFDRPAAKKIIAARAAS